MNGEGLASWAWEADEGLGYEHLQSAFYEAVARRGLIPAAVAPQAAGQEEPETDGISVIPQVIPRAPAVIPKAPIVAPQVVAPSVAQVGAETDGVAFNGNGAMVPIGYAATPTAVPLVGAVAAVMSLGVFKALLAKFGPFLLKVMVGAAAFTGFMKLLGMGASDDVVLPIKPGERKRKRYSIGHNPRVRTLQKVSRHCMRMLKKHRKVIDEFLPSKRAALPARALARTYLSTAERKALKA